MTQKSKEKRLFENTVFIYIMRIATYIFPLITTPYLTRVLMENNYGIYTWANAIINYARLVVDFGFVIYGVEVIARCKNNKKKIGMTIYVIIKYKVILCIICGLVLSFLCMFIGEFHKYALMIGISYLPVIISIFGIDYVFQGMEQMKYITTRVVITKGIFTALVFICVKNSEQYMLVPILTMIGDSIAILTMWSSARKLGICLIKSKLSDGIELLTKSAWYFASRISGAVFSYGNTILLGIFISKTQVAQFSVAYTLITVGQNFITPLADSLYPYMVKNQNYKMVKKLMIIFEPLIIIACIIGFFIAKPVVTLWFGAEYEEAAKILCYMIPIILIALPGCLCGYPVLSSLGLYKEVNIAIILAAIFHIVGWIILLYTGRLTVYSVAILTSITEFLVVLNRGFFIVKERRKRNK